MFSLTTTRALRAVLGAGNGRGDPGAAAARARPMARPAHARMPAKFAGAFVNWGPDGREKMLQVWEKWLNQKPSSVLGVDFYAQSTWEDYSKLSWVPGIWKKLNPARNVVWSMPLTVKGTPLAEVAEGLHDAAFEAAARAIAEAHPKAIIRLGWEMNWSTRPGSPRARRPTTSPPSAASSEFSGGTRTVQIRLVPGLGAAGTAGGSRLSRRRCRRLHRPRRLRFQAGGIAAGALGHALSESAVRPGMAPRLRRPTRQADELPGMGRRPVRRQSLLHPADARLVRAERGQHRLCGLFRRRRTMADADRQQPVSANRRSCSGSCSGADPDTGSDGDEDFKETLCDG